MGACTICRRKPPTLLLVFPLFADTRCSLSCLWCIPCWVFVLTSARALCLFCICRSTGGREAFVLLPKATTISLPHLDSLSLFLFYCGPQLYLLPCLVWLRLWSLQMQRPCGSFSWGLNARVCFPQERLLLTTGTERSQAWAAVPSLWHLSRIRHLLCWGSWPCQNISQLWVTELANAIITTSTTFTHTRRFNP